MTFDEMFDNKWVRFTLYGATGLHIFMSMVSALSKDKISEMGVLSILLGVFCLGAVISTSLCKPFSGPVIAILIILIPGVFMGFLTTLVLYGMIFALIFTPLEFLYQAWVYFITHYTIIIL